MTPAVAAVTGYLRILQSRLVGRTSESPEALLADLVPDLLRTLAVDAGHREVDLLGQAYEPGVGRPDFSVKRGPLLVGHVETKAPGTGADAAAFTRSHDRRQWERFQRLPNLLYTDGTAFALYRSGSAYGPIVRMSFDPGDPQQEAEPDETAALVALVGEFLSWRAAPPGTLGGLAEKLAPLCALLRDEVRAQLADRSSEVAKAAAEFEESLFPGRAADEIADAFAQVCAYSMLLARANGATRLDAGSIESALRRGHPVLGRVVRVLLDEQTEGELGWALDTVRTLIEVVDFERLRRGRLLPGMTHHDQTWLYFYEEFLARYDPRLRDQYGVYYTPQQVISAQVALVEEVLRTRLGLPLGLASPDVTVLDPAVGTGSYPIRVVLAAAAAARERLGAPAVGGVLRALAQNLHAFEILVGPYAVAHLRLAEVLADAGADVAGDAVHVYLTDTLSSPHATPAQLTRLLEPLVEEQRRALRAKADVPILVCVGNPPYERGRRGSSEGEEGGGWVVHGEGPATRAIFEDFLAPAREAGLGAHLKNLYNEYVYFWRWALWKVFEDGDDGTLSDTPGIVSYITGASYLGGPAFVGLRERLRRACDEIWIIDLGGEGRGARRDDNVFAIQTPVAIAVAVRAGPSRVDVPATVRYTRVRGDRATKLATLDAAEGLERFDWEECPDGWRDPFLPAPATAWTAMPGVTELFPWHHSGAQIKRTWPIAPDRTTLEERWRALLSSEDRATAFRETRDRTIRSTPRALTADDRPPAVADLPADAPPPPIVRYGFRPLDRQWLLADSRLADFPRPELWRTLSGRQVFMVSFLTQVLGPGPAAVATALIPDLDHFRGSFGGRHVVPLYRDAAGTPNVQPAVLGRIGAALGTEVSAEDLFAYAYGVLSAPAYVERFFEELRQPGPRLPVTASAELFPRVVEIGHRMVWLHTYGQRSAGGDRPRGGVPPGAARLVAAIPDVPERYPEEVSYDESTGELRVGEGVVGPVQPEVWQWSVSGLQVARTWLRYRLRGGAGRGRSAGSPLDRIRPAAWPGRYTTELLELLWVLEATVTSNAAQAELLEEVVAGPLLDRRRLLGDDG